MISSQQTPTPAVTSPAWTDEAFKHSSLSLSAEKKRSRSKSLSRQHIDGTSTSSPTNTGTFAVASGSGAESSGAEEPPKPSARTNSARSKRSRSAKSIEKKSSKPSNTPQGPPLKSDERSYNDRNIPIIKVEAKHPGGEVPPGSSREGTSRRGVSTSKLNRSKSLSTKEQTSSGNAELSISRPNSRRRAASDAAEVEYAQENEHVGTDRSDLDPSLQTGSDVSSPTVALQMKLKLHIADKTAGDKDSGRLATPGGAMAGPAVPTPRATARGSPLKSARKSAGASMNSSSGRDVDSPRKKSEPLESARKGPGSPRRNSVVGHSPPPRRNSLAQSPRGKKSRMSSASTSKIEDSSDGPNSRRNSIKNLRIDSPPSPASASGEGASSSPGTARKSQLFAKLRRGASIIVLAKPRASPEEKEDATESDSDSDDNSQSIGGNVQERVRRQTSARTMRKSTMTQGFSGRFSVKNGLKVAGGDVSVTSAKESSRKSSSSNMKKLTAGLVSALHVATRDGDLVAVETLVQQGVDLQQTDSQGQSALHIASRENLEQMTLLLLRSWADPLQTDSQENTPLHVALQMHNHSVARILIQHMGPAQLFQMQNLDGETPYMLILKTRSDHLTMACLDRCYTYDSHVVHGLQKAKFWLHPLLQTGRNTSTYDSVLGLTLRANLRHSTAHPVIQEIIRVKWRTIGYRLWISRTWMYGLFLITAVSGTLLHSNVLRGIFTNIHETGDLSFASPKDQNLILLGYLCYAITAILACFQCYYLLNQLVNDTIIAFLTSPSSLLDAIVCLSEITSSLWAISEIAARDTAMLSLNLSAAAMVLVLSNTLLHLQVFPFFGTMTRTIGSLVTNVGMKYCLIFLVISSGFVITTYCFLGYTSINDAAIGTYLMVLARNGGIQYPLDSTFGVSLSALKILFWDLVLINLVTAMINKQYATLHELASQEALISRGLELIKLESTLSRYERTRAMNMVPDEIERWVKKEELEAVFTLEERMDNISAMIEKVERRLQALMQRLDVNFQLQKSLSAQTHQTLFCLQEIYRTIHGKKHARHSISRRIEETDLKAAQLTP